jgi:hypothetical protein
MKTLLSLFALVAFPLSVATAAPVNHSLDFLNRAVYLHYTWDAGPNLNPQESKLQVEWIDGSGRSPIPAPGNFKVELFMPAMEHGSSPTDINPVLDDRGYPYVGVFQVSSMYFTMPGDWEVRVTLTTPDGKMEMEKFSVHL